MNKILHPLLLCVFLLFSNTLIAQEAKPQEPVKYYDVEIIVFRNDKVPRGHEINLPTPAASIAANAVDLSSPESIRVGAQKGFTPLKPDELQLMDKVQGIIKSSRYSLLLHTGWRQPGTEESRSIPVWIKGGKVYSNHYSSIDQFRDLGSVNPEPGSQGAEAIAPAPEQLRPTPPQGLYELEGQITVSLSRYLHTNAELVLRKPADALDVINQQADSSTMNDDSMEVMQGQFLLNYGLNEKRRMRSRKLHYLDSPQFGMLVLITPYEAPEQPAVGESNAPDSQLNNGDNATTPQADAG
jgi:hypothetical protein